MKHCRCDQIVYNEMWWEFSSQGASRNVLKMSNGKLSRNDALESQFVGWRIILQSIVWNWDVKIRTVWSWFGLEKQKIPFQTHSWLIDSCWRKDWLLKCDLKELPLDDSKVLGKRGGISINYSKKSRVCVCLHTHIYVHTYVCVCVYIHIHTYIYTYTHTHTPTAQGILGWIMIDWWRQYSWITVILSRNFRLNNLIFQEK